MAILWLEGFDWIDPAIDTDAQLAYAMAKRYPDLNFGTDVDTRTTNGRQGGTGILWKSYGQSFQTPALQTVDDTFGVYIGFAVRVGNSFYNSDTIIEVRRYSEYQCYFNMWLDGSARIYPAASGSFLPSLSPYRWYYLEFYFYIHDTAGAYEMRVNGDTIVSDSGVDTRYRGYDGWTSILFKSFGNESIYDDIYISKDGFLGDVKVKSLKPSAAHTTNWTLFGAGSNHEAVDDVPVHPTDRTNVWTDTDYVYSDTATTKDLYEFDDLPSEFSSATIHLVVLHTVVRTTNPQLMTLKTKCLSNVTEVDAATEKLMWDEYNLVSALLPENPDISGAWTYSTVNAAKFGIEVG